MAKAYNVKNMAQILCLSERRVRQLADEGIVPEVSDGWFKLLPAVQGYIKYLQGLVENPQKEQAQRLLTLKADRAELELNQKRGELHATQDVELFVGNLLVAFRAKLTGLAFEVVPELLAVQDSEDFAGDAIEVLRGAMEQALVEFSELSTEKIGEVYDEQEYD